MLIVVRFIMFVLDRALKMAKLTPEPESEVCHVREAGQKNLHLGLPKLGALCHSNIIMSFMVSYTLPLLLEAIGLLL